jgi:hypothetical protein
MVSCYRSTSITTSMGACVALDTDTYSKALFYLTTTSFTVLVSTQWYSTQDTPFVVRLRTCCVPEMDASGSSYVSPQTSSVSLKHILLSEVLSVTSVMRKNSRWAMSTNTYGSFSDSTLASSFGLRRTRQYPEPYISDQGSKEQELMRGFQELRRLVKDIDGTRLN